MTTGSIRSRVHFPTGLLFTAPQVFASPLRALDRPSARCPARPPNNGQIPIRPATTLHQDRHKATITAMEYRQATVKDAAHELGISTRTVERRIKSGDLPSEAVNGRRYVLFPADTNEPPPTDDAETNDMPDWLDPYTVQWLAGDIRKTLALISDPTNNPGLLLRPLSQAQAAAQEQQLRTVEDERDHWRNEAQQLHQRLSEVTATLYRQTDQKALAPPDNQTDSRRHWWRIWRSPRSTRQ